MEPLIVLLSGKQLVGKTTTAMLLQEKLKNDIVFTYFKFIEILYEIHDSAVETLKHYGLKTAPKEATLLQLIGDWSRNKYGKTVWSDLTKNKIEALQSKIQSEECAKPILFVNDDCRFEHEFNAFPNALHIRLVCPKEIRKERNPNLWREDENHISEIDLDEYEASGKFDLVISTENTPPEIVADIVYKEISKRI